MPIRQPLQRVPEALKETIESEVTRMLSKVSLDPVLVRGHHQW